MRPDASSGLPIHRWEDEPPCSPTERLSAQSCKDPIEVGSQSPSSLPAEWKLETSEYLFRLAFERSSVALAVLDAQGCWVLFNQAFCDVFDETSARLRSTNLLALVRPEHRAALKADLTLSTGRIKQVERLFDRGRKGLIWGQLHLSASSFEDGSSPLWICQFEDVTERRLAQAEEAQERHLLAETIACAPIAIALFDTSMCYLAHSARWLEEHDKLGQTIVGRSHYEVNPDIPERWREIHRRCQVGEVISADEDAFERVDGQIHYYRWAVHPWRTTDGQIGGIVVVVNRINDLVRAREEALETSRLKSQFLANMSHEIRTPMNGVLGTVELLLDTPLTLEQRDLASTILESGRSFLTLINDILDFSKIESGKLAAESQVFNLRTVVEEIASIMALSAQLKGVELVCDFPAFLFEWYTGDSARIRQILLNLVGNAVKFTDEGKIRISARAIRRDAPQGDNEPRTLIELSVQDTGVGIPKSRRESIFESFTQGDGSSSRPYGGTGLGLSICQSLVRILGGTITLESEPGRGSVFSFRIPLIEHPGPAPKAREARPLQGVSVLVATENVADRASIRLQIESWGGSVIEVDDASDALILLESSLSNRQSAILLADEQMAESNPLLKRAFDETQLAATPIVVMTSGSTKSKTSTLGCWAVAKPIQPARLLEVLTQLIQSRSKLTPSVTRTSGANSSEKARLTGIRVLLAEDNPINQKVAVRMLKRLGCEVEVAADGSEVLGKVEHLDFDVVLMDLQMPKMDGYQATNAVRQLEQQRTTRKRLPIIAMTANALQGDRERCLAAEMDDYLSKPVTISELTEVIERWVRLNPKTTVEAMNPNRPMNPAPSPPTLRLARLRELSQGDAGFERELLEILINDISNEINRLRIALDPLDAPLASTILHGIVGACRTVGADALGLVCRNLEEQTKNPRFEPEASWLISIERERERLVIAVADHGQQG